MQIVTLYAAYFLPALTINKNIHGYNEIAQNKRLP
jgi:hypothetical protein